jgi:hypothetical protein
LVGQTAHVHEKKLRPLSRAVIDTRPCGADTTVRPEQLSAGKGTTAERQLSGTTARAGLHRREPDVKSMEKPANGRLAPSGAVNAMEKQRPAPASIHTPNGTCEEELTEKAGSDSDMPLSRST